MQTNCTPNTLSVGAVFAPTLDIYAIQNDANMLHVYDARIIRLLSEVFRVPYRVFIPQDGEFGTKLSDGTWSGTMGMVLRSETDLVVGGITLDADKFNILNFSYPFLFSDLTFMTDKLKPVSTNLALLNPFTLNMWITLIAVIFFVSFLIFFLTNKTRTYKYILLMTYGTVLEKPFLIELQRTSHRLLVCAWLIFSFLITNIYKGLFLSFLTLPNFTGIRDISDLTHAAQRNLVTCYSFDNKMLFDELFQAGFDSSNSILKCLQWNDITSYGGEEAFVKAKPGKAFLAGRIYLKPYKQKYFISEDSVFNSMHAFPLSRNFSYKKDYLNKMIHRLYGAGIFQKIYKDEELQLELKTLKSNEYELDNIKPLQIEDLKGAFLVLCFGYILSAFVLIIEIAVNYYFPDKG